MDLDYLNNEDLSVIAYWKILLLEYGVDSNKDFRDFPNANLYKMKLRKMKPVASAFKVIDVETEQALIPSEILICDGRTSCSIVKLRYNPDSPFCLAFENTENASVKIVDKRNDNVAPIGVSLVHTPKNLVTKVEIEGNIKEIKVFDYISLLGMDRVSIIPYDGCWNWNQGEPCKFCDLHPKRNAEMNTFRPTLNDLSDFNFDVNVWWNHYSENYFTCLKAALECFFANVKMEPHFHLMIMAGNVPDNKLLWNICNNIVDILEQYVNLKCVDSYLNISPHDKIEDLIALKKKGIKQVQYNLEISNKERFRDACPGKLPQKEIIKKLEEAVSIMGKGNVRSNFVLGLQPIDELLDDIKKLSSKGIVCDYSFNLSVELRMQSIVRLKWRKWFLFQ